MSAELSILCQSTQMNREVTTTGQKSNTMQIYKNFTQPVRNNTTSKKLPTSIRQLPKTTVENPGDFYQGYPFQY